jgi:hypothetical protein
LFTGASKVGQSDRHALLHPHALEDREALDQGKDPTKGMKYYYFIMIYFNYP